MTGRAGEDLLPGATGRGVSQDAGAPRPSAPVYALADVDALGASEIGVGEIPDAIAAMARGGATWIQLRAKRLADRSFFDLARACRDALAGSGAMLWIDDRPDVAVLAGAGGVHLGQTDLPPVDVRRVVGPSLRIGFSTHDRDQVLAAVRDSAVDVIAVGPVFPTASKEAPDPVVGLDLVRWARGATDKPLVAIGGIDESNIAAVLDAGADAVAVLSAVCGGDGEAAVRRLTAAASRSSGSPVRR